MRCAVQKGVPARCQGALLPVCRGALVPWCEMSWVVQKVAPAFWTTQLGDRVWLPFRSPFGSPLVPFLAFNENFDWVSSILMEHLHFHVIWTFARP